MRHGHNTRAARSSEHVAWSNMIQRCTDPRRRGFKNYGGRGIAVSPEFRGPDGFKRFLDEVGPRPAGMTLDRRDNDKGYEPGNLRWATRVQQVRNSRVVRPVMRSDGKQYSTIVDAARDVERLPENIGAVCRGAQRTAGGYGWAYL